MNNRKVSGNQNEVLAVKFLQKKNYKIITRNYYQRCGEVDIIAEKNQVIVFVEVKSLSTEVFRKLEESVSWAKRNRILKTALFWLLENGKSNCDWRVDYIGINCEHGIIRRILHIENIISG